MQRVCKEFCEENFNIKLVFNSFKIKKYFSYIDQIPNDLKSFPVYKFTCASCSSSYIDKTCRHFKTRIEEHIKKDNKSHIFKHLHSTATYFDWYNYLCFKIIDKANSKFDLKMKEALHKPNFKCTTKSLSTHPFNIGSVPLVLFCFHFFFFLFCCFYAFLFPLLFSLPLMLIIGIFYCLNYTSLLLYLITTHLVWHLCYLSANYWHLVLS